VETRQFDASAEMLDVHVGIRHMTGSDVNSAPAGSSRRDVRFMVRESELPDLNRAGAMAPIDVAYPNVRLFFSGEEQELETHESFKLAELVATGELKRPFGLSRSYCPPLACIQAFPPLSDRIAEIVAQIAAKVRVVAGRTTTHAIADLPRMWMRYTLARMTPVLRHLLSTGETNPFQLYTTMVETAASLAAFNLEEPAELPIYQHENLHDCFGELIAFLDTQLEEAVPDRFHELQLAYDGAKKLYVTDALNTDLVDPRNLFFLAIKAELETEELVHRVTNEARAGSQGTVKVALLTNTEGVRFEHMSGAPTEIAARAGFQYFSIDPHGPKWKKVREDFDFALSLAKVESADVRLYVVEGER
jgi:type VI secretion system protein ImpJ